MVALAHRRSNRPDGRLVLRQPAQPARTPSSADVRRVGAARRIPLSRVLAARRAVGDGLFAWLVTFAVATRVSMAFYLVPWNALFAEFSDDYAERTAIVTFRYPRRLDRRCRSSRSARGRFIFPSSAEFAKGQLNPAAYHLFAPILGVLVARLRVHHDAPDAQRDPLSAAASRSPVPFSLKRVLAEVLLALRNRDFLVLFMTLLTSSAIGGTDRGAEHLHADLFLGAARRSAALVRAGDSRIHGCVRDDRRSCRRASTRNVSSSTACRSSSLNGVAMIGLRFLDVLPAERLAVAAAAVDRQRDHPHRRVHRRGDHVRDRWWPTRSTRRN